MGAVKRLLTEETICRDSFNCSSIRFCSLSSLLTFSMWSFLAFQNPREWGRQLQHRRAAATKVSVTATAVIIDEVASALSISILLRLFTTVLLMCDELYMASDPLPSWDPARYPDPANSPPATIPATIPVITGMLDGWAGWGWGWG